MTALVPGPFMRRATVSSPAVVLDDLARDA